MSPRCAWLSPLLRLKAPPERGRPNYRRRPNRFCPGPWRRYKAPPCAAGRTPVAASLGYREFLAGNVFRGQRPRPAVLVTPAGFGRQRPHSPAAPATKPRKVKRYSERARKSELRGTAWWWMHSTATGLHPEFPANREINRDFFDFGHFLAIPAPNRRANSVPCWQIPCATEQGIFSAEQGMFLREQGISAKHQGSGQASIFRTLVQGPPIAICSRPRFADG
jgi:hypothetical protein